MDLNRLEAFLCIAERTRIKLGSVKEAARVVVTDNSHNPSPSSTLQTAWCDGGGRAICNGFASLSVHQWRSQNAFVKLD
jgi:hypothetical protein